MSFVQGYGAREFVNNGLKPGELAIFSTEQVCSLESLSYVFKLEGVSSGGQRELVAFAKIYTTFSQKSSFCSYVKELLF